MKTNSVLPFAAWSRSLSVDHSTEAHEARCIPRRAARFARSLGITMLFVLIFAGCASFPIDNQQIFQAGVDTIPVTHLRFQNNPDNFQFVVIGDRTGGEREGVFDAAMDRVNLLQPEFVVSIGDNIEGYHHDKARLNAEWRRFDEEVSKLEMPFFMTAGNHDLNNDAQRDVWQRRMGATYYHFVYRDVLFLILNSEDPSHLADPEFEKDIAAYNKLKKTDPAAAKAMLEEFMASAKLKKYRLPANFRSEQVAYVKETLAENPDVRWTFVFLHQPAWENPAENFLKIDHLLRENERNYTVFAGHLHYYKHEERLGRDYITVGPAGGSWHQEGPGNIDHLTWVTMTENGPKIAVITLDGIVDRKGVAE